MYCKYYWCLHAMPEKWVEVYHQPTYMIGYLKQAFKTYLQYTIYNGQYTIYFVMEQRHWSWQQFHARPSTHLLWHCILQSIIPLLATPISLLSFILEMYSLHKSWVSNFLFVVSDYMLPANMLVGTYIVIHVNGIVIKMHRREIEIEFCTITLTTWTKS